MRLHKTGGVLAGLAASGLAALVLAAPAHAQQTAYAIANGGSTLITFNTNNPTGATQVGTFKIGGVATFLDAIDFRPLNGQLYGYLDSTDTLYSVSLADASLTAIASGMGATATTTSLLGMDFNPMIDRVRVVTEAGENLVYNPNSSAVPAGPPAVTPLFYPAGDPGATAPLGARIIENAYSNNIALSGLSTTQYGIDYGTDSLVTIANNAGTLTTVGALGLNINDSLPFVGFDIFTSIFGVNTAYTVFDTTTGLSPSLYTVNLTGPNAGKANQIGAIGGGFIQVYSLAVRPSAPGSFVPEPGTVGLLLGALAPAGAFLLRRSRCRHA